MALKPARSAMEVGKPLMLIASEHRVRLLDGTQEVASHARTFDKGRSVEAPAHLSALAAQKARAHELRGRDLLKSCCVSLRSCPGHRDKRWRAQCTA